MKKSGSNMERLATNLDLVGTLTSDFLKKNGKKGLTRRHVMAFLQESGYHQYLASDIVRCLQQRHNVNIVDVLDQFPLSDKKAAVGLHSAAVAELTKIRRSMASLPAFSPEANRSIRKCGDSIMESVAELVRGLRNE